MASQWSDDVLTDVTLLTLQWLYYGLTLIRSWAYSDHTTEFLQLSDHDLTVITLLAHSYQTMTLEWSYWWLTIIRPWPYTVIILMAYSCQTMTIQWSYCWLIVIGPRPYIDHTTDLRLSDYGLTVNILRAYIYQNMTLQTGFCFVPEVQPFPLPNPQNEPGTHPIPYTAGTVPPPSIKCRVRKGDHSPLHSADVKNVCSYMSTSPYSYLMLCVVKYMNNLVYIRIRCVIKAQKWDINMFGNLALKVAVSFETFVFLTDYTTSYPRSQCSSLLWEAAYTAGIAKTQLNLVVARL